MLAKFKFVKVQTSSQLKMSNGFSPPSPWLLQRILGKLYSWGEIGNFNSFYLSIYLYLGEVSQFSMGFSHFSHGFSHFSHGSALTAGAECPAVELYYDSGVRSGRDVAKALCLGARRVGIGRPWLGDRDAGRDGDAGTGWASGILMDIIYISSYIYDI